MGNGKNLNIAMIYSSPTFKFLVGPDKKEFFIHKSLVADLSPALNALVNNGMQEAREGFVEWPEVDEETFSRFAEFAYTGDYPAAEPEILPIAPDGGPDPEPSMDQPQEGPPAKKRRAGTGPTDTPPAAPSTPVFGIGFSNSEGEEEEEEVEEGSGDESESGSFGPTSSEGEGEEEYVSAPEQGTEPGEPATLFNIHAPLFNHHPLFGGHAPPFNGHGDGRNFNHRNNGNRSHRDSSPQGYNSDDDGAEFKSHRCRGSSRPNRRRKPFTSLQTLFEHMFPRPDPVFAHATSINRDFFGPPNCIGDVVRADREDSEVIPHYPRMGPDCVCFNCAGPGMAQILRTDKCRKIHMFAALPQPSPAEAELNYEPPTFKVPRNNEKNESIAPVLLSHAKMWVVGDIYDIPRLRLLAARKLNRTLMWLRRHEERVGDITEVARYIYENSCDAGDVVGLRPMIAMYLVIIMEDVAHTEEIRNLLVEVGELARDVTTLMVRRVW